ncbi:DNA (cytosine-5)-methyltransferase 1 [Methanococcus maripaludis]|uniref:DNA (cytosine-5-)-methyltransferase n=1 Tax=Methanococcus maripaludis TaxID=39152 RepID=A0A7J9NMA1_METMI|nr:DNA cytosine methyltransferase [Methanococcus maripaludis]MBA2846607.1 DNA (cytosine-5)-methyltransferase 1 [Methanococcus maripaludis]
MTEKFRTLDLFAGVGGIRLGFDQAGFKTVYANDIEPSCKETYDLNFEDAKLHIEDINCVKIEDLPEFDVLLAGFPCQPFSIAGYRKGFCDEGRGDLFFKIAEILDERRPKAFLLENVKNLKGHDSGKTFEIISKTLQDLGYHFKHAVLNAMEYGNIPQNRERIYIVGFLSSDACSNFKFPEEIPLECSFREFLEKDVPEKYHYEGKFLYDKIKDDVKSMDTVYQWRRKYVRDNKKGVVPTLTANMGTGGHNVPIILEEKGIRKLTPKECFMFQGYPSTFKLPDISDGKLYKQAGNSVVVPVIKRIAENMKKVLEMDL